jgi:hypothetical protein
VELEETHLHQDHIIRDLTVQGTAITGIVIEREPNSQRSAEKRDSNYQIQRSLKEKLRKILMCGG